MTHTTYSDGSKVGSPAFAFFFEIPGRRSKEVWDFRTKKGVQTQLCQITASKIYDGWSP